MKLRYFAWVRERVGKPEEDIEVPAGVATVGELMTWLSSRGEEYAHAFANPKVIRAAIDRAHVKPQTPIKGAARNRLFPADDGGLASRARARYITSMTALSTVRLQREPFDAAAEAAKLDARAHRRRRAGHLHRHLPRRRSGRADRRAHARALSRHGGGRDRAPRRGGESTLAAAWRHRHPPLRAHRSRARTSCWWRPRPRIGRRPSRRPNS